MSTQGKKYNHELRILKGYHIKELELQYKQYLNSIQDKFGDSFNVSTWFELFDEGKGRPLIHMFITVEDYMNEKEYEEFKKKT